MLYLLSLMNLEVGDDNLTDYKHIFKCLRNLMLREKDFHVHAVHIKPSVICSHLISNNLNSTQINYLLNPNNWQDVKLAYDMLSDIWSLPDLLPHTLPGFIQARSSFKILRELFHHILILYICVDLSLSKQLVHLSAAAHLLLALFSDF
jgi:hypothetical protein